MTGMLWVYGTGEVQLIGGLYCWFIDLQLFTIKSTTIESET